MNSETITLLDFSTTGLFILSAIFSIYTLFTLIKTKKQLITTGIVLDDMKIISIEMVKEHDNIFAYNNMKYCAFDLDVCTVTIIFDDKQEAMNFLDTHENKSTVKMVFNNKVVKKPFCEGCE